MKRFVFRISVVLFLVILLPIIFFISKQLTNLTENEELVQEAYEKQLESVLFTINLHAENILYAWVNRIDLPVELTDKLLKEMIDRILSDNQALQQVTFFRTSDRVELASFVRDGSLKQPLPFPDKNKIKKLEEYQSVNNYQRLDADRVKDYTEIYFIPKSTANMACAFIVHTQTFIDLNLGSAMQKVAQERFSLSVIDDSTNNSIYRLNSLPSNLSSTLSNKLWYLPGYSLNISLFTATINDLVKQRSQRDQYFLWGIMFIVIVGSCFLIINIRKEVKLAEMKSEFVSNVSHEIRTPLALISMYAETLMLKRIKTPEKADEYLRVINLETNRLSAMVNRILSFSKMEKNKRKYHFTSFQLNELVAEVIESFSPYFAEHKVTIDVQLQPETLPVCADRDALAEALINVVENAVKYGKDENKRIAIRTQQTAEHTLVEIEDNGIGISPKHQKYIFDQFYRVTQGNLANKVKGTGLGLNIVKQILKVHHGTVGVKSKLGEGSCFQLKFKNHS